MTARSLLKHGLPLFAAALIACATRSGNEYLYSSTLHDAAGESAARLGLVEMRVFLPDVPCDLRYGTDHNITGKILYPATMPCLLYRPTAAKLAQAQDILRPEGLGLKIWDAWRPPEVQAELFRYGQTTDRASLFVNPEEAWSFHCSGTAVDVTLVDGEGREMPLPTDFDDPGPHASNRTPISDPRVLQNVRALQDAMLRSGFSMIDREWWHFDDAAFTSASTCRPTIFPQAIGLALPVQGQ